MSENEFLKGVALSVYQNSGGVGTNWDTFLKQRNCLRQPKVGDGRGIQTSCDFWRRYEEDIALVAGLGATAFRISFEWHRLQPVKGSIDEFAVQRYDEILDCCEKHGLTPMGTLHHFVHPSWFQRLGAFEVEKNIPIFVDYCLEVVSRFQKRVKIWATFNEPNCFTFSAYIMGIYPPGHFLKFKLAGQVVLNMLKAHEQVYFALKKLPGGDELMVGFVHQMIDFQPKGTGILYTFHRSLCKWMRFFFGRDLILRYFHTGKYSWSAPFWGELITHQCDATSAGKPPLDWIGMNYYTRVVISLGFQLTGMQGEAVSDMGFAVYPKGMYENLKLVGELGVPVYITETGIADERDVYRPKLISDYYTQIFLARRDGVDVRGIFYWTLMDNFEWHEGFKMRFGLYACQHDKKDKPRQRRDVSCDLLTDIYSLIPSDLNQLKQTDEIERVCKQIQQAYEQCQGFQRVALDMETEMQTYVDSEQDSLLNKAS